MKKNKIQGLSENEVQKKLEEFGYNEIIERKVPAWILLFKKLWSPIPWMIEIAIVLSVLMKKWEDVVIISILLGVNILVDYTQESKALSALDALKKKLAKKALVLREGKFKNINARQLVPGDIIKLKIGDIVPADVNLIKGEYLQIDQSALTGESLLVDKKRNDEVYSGSIIKIGEMLAKITKTGANTFFGKSANLTAKAKKEEESHFQKAIIRIGNFLIIFSASLALIIMVISVTRQNSLLEDLQFILILIIASIPVALPAVLSVTMAVGALSIIKRRAIVSNISAIEELAGADILCIDKTGTITQNKISVGETIQYDNFTKEDLFNYAVMASQEENNDPIERPIFKYFKNNFSNKNGAKNRQIKFTPFDPIIKRTEVVLVDNNGIEFTIIKGAPQIIKSMCDDNVDASSFFTDIQNFAEKGYRTLAVAIKENNDKKFKCIGLIALFDPPRNDSKKIIAKIKEMGIRVKMLTGDNHAIAVQIANVLKIGDNILDIAMFKKITKKNNQNKIGFIEKTDGFSQVMPADKYFIIDKLKKNNHIVAMTGDGVNDAPALQKADIGIAVAGATDAARAAADLILLAPGLAVITHAIKIARQTFERMKGYAIFRIAETIRIILFITLSIIVFNFYPVTAVMIIMLALLNDIPVMMIAYDNAHGNDNPVKWNMKEVLTVAMILGIAGVISSFLLFYWLHINNYPLLFIQSMLFIKLDVAGHSTLYLTRTGRHHFWHKPFPSWKFFLPAFGSRIIGTLIAVYGVFMTPIGWKYAGYMWLYALVWWFFNDFVKVITYKFLDRKK